MTTSKKMIYNQAGNPNYQVRRFNFKEKNLPNNLKSKQISILTAVGVQKQQTIGRVLPHMPPCYSIISLPVFEVDVQEFYRSFSGGKSYCGLVWTSTNIYFSDSEIPKICFFFFGRIVNLSQDFGCGHQLSCKYLHVY